jgi:hypothetical protein
MIARVALSALAWVLWTEESQVTPATTSPATWSIVAGTDTREDCERLGRHRVDSFPRVRVHEVAITPIGERALIWAQATPPLTKVVVFKCLPASDDPRPK